MQAATEKPQEPNLLGDLYSLLEFGMGDTKLRISELHPAARSGLWGSPTPNSTACKDRRAGKPRGSTGNEDTGKKKNVFTAKKADSRRVVVTHGQGHQRSRLQPQYRSWGSPCPCKLNTAITKSSPWLSHKGWLISAGQARHRVCPGTQLSAFQSPEQRAKPRAASLPTWPATHPNPPFSPARCPGAPEPTLGDLQSICGGAPQEPQQQLLSAACNYIPGRRLIYGT